MKDNETPSKRTFNPLAAAKTILLIISITAVPHAYSTENHPTTNQNLLTLARKFVRLTEGNCGSSDLPQRPLDLSKVWSTVGHALMAGLDCSDRLLCPGHPSCHQLIDLALKPNAAPNRQARHVPARSGRYGGNLDTFPIQDSVHSHSPPHDSTGTLHHLGQGSAGAPHIVHRRSTVDVGSVSQARYLTQPSQFLYDGAVHGMEGQLTLSQAPPPLEQTNIQRQIAMPAAQNYPPHMREHNSQGEDNLPVSGYYWLPPHPQTMWWLQQDAMRGQAGTPDASHSQNRYQQSAPVNFRANSYDGHNEFHEDYSDGYRKNDKVRQVLPDKTDVHSAQQWNRPASRDRRQGVTDLNDDDELTSKHTEVRQRRNRPRTGKRKKKPRRETNALTKHRRNSTRTYDRRRGQQPQPLRRNRLHRLRRTRMTLPIATPTATKAVESSATMVVTSASTRNIETTTTMDMESTTRMDMESTARMGMESTARIDMDMKSTARMDMDMELTARMDMEPTARMDMESTTTVNMESRRTVDMGSKITMDMALKSTVDMESTARMDMESTTAMNVESTSTMNMESKLTPTVDATRSAERLTTKGVGSTETKTDGSTTAQTVDKDTESDRLWQRSHGAHHSPANHDNHGHSGPDNTHHGSHHRDDQQNDAHSEHYKDDDDDYDDAGGGEGHQEHQSDRHHINPGPQSPRRPTDHPQQHPVGSFGQQPMSHRASFFNQSAVFIGMFFTAIAHISRLGEDCNHSQDNLSSPSAWVEGVCSRVEREAGGGDVGQREVRRLEELVRKVFRRWRHDRFTRTVYIDNEQFMEQHKCFNVVVPEERRPHRITAQNCHRELHDFITRFATAIFLRLLQGHRPVTADQPCEADFMEDVFDKYGTQNKRAISVQGIQSLLDKVAWSTNCSQEAGPSQMQRQSADQQSTGHNSLLPHDHHDVGTKGQTAHDVTLSTRSGRSQHAVNRRISARELVDTVLGNMTKIVNVQQFYRLCPALLQQLMVITSTRPMDRRVLEEHEQEEEKEEEPNIYAGTAMQTYGLGTVSVTVITLCSLLGAVVVRVCRGVGQDYAMASLLALAVGNLCGDALLHLLPEALGLGRHHPQHGVYDSDDGDHSHYAANDDDSGIHHLAGGLVIDDVRLKCLALLASVYVFWLMEIVTCRWYQPTPEANDKPTEENDNANTYEMISPECEPKPQKNTDVQLGQYQNSSGHLVWMIVMGDAVHNLADGLAIGAAFAHSVPLGLSTSMAVVSHELPHELGDIAVLMSTGMKVKKALLLNLLSALTAFVGLYVGLGVGTHLSARQWIFVIVAGMFLYVSLADLIPELVRYFRFCGNAKMFVVQSLGLLVGFSLMFLLVLVEGKLHF